MADPTAWQRAHVVSCDPQSGGRFVKDGEVVADVPPDTVVSPVPGTVLYLLSRYSTQSRFWLLPICARILSCSERRSRSVSPEQSSLGSSVAVVQVLAVTIWINGVGIGALSRQMWCLYRQEQDGDCTTRSLAAI